MEQPKRDSCTCSGDGYSPDCPRIAVVGGRHVHVIDEENRLKPRRYTRNDNGDHASEPRDSQPAGQKAIEARIQELEMQVRSAIPVTAPLAVNMPPVIHAEPEQLHAGFDVHGVQGRTVPQLPHGAHATVIKGHGLVVGGVKLTEATVGGYSMDEEVHRQKFLEVAPLPAVRLPIVFANPDLNFIHHFFQGMDLLGGRAAVRALAEARSYTDLGEDAVLPLIMALLSAGYSQTDSQLMSFVKRVLEATFRPAKFNTPSGPVDGLQVMTNYYGFEYLSEGMEMKEADLQMWISMSYKRYEIAWFDAFKSSGLPAFAKQGVQDRYVATGVLTSKYPVRENSAPRHTSGDRTERDPARRGAEEYQSSKPRHRDSDSIVRKKKGFFY